MPSVAIAGYTNAGKSSLLNRLTGAGVLVENQLFATLDPTVRRAETADGRLYTLADTVGFVRDLPHQLVEAFRSTLEEVGDSDLLLHVVDGSHPDPEGQISAVRGVLAEVGGDQLKEIIVVNKADAADPEVLDRLRRATRSTASSVSARTGQGLAELQALIAEELPRPGHRRSTVLRALRPGRPGQPAAPGGRGALQRAHRARHAGARPRSTGTWSATSRPTPSETPLAEGHRRRAVPFVRPVPDVRPVDVPVVRASAVPVVRPPRWHRLSVPGLNLGAMAPDLDALLHAAVQGVGGVERPGQVTMAKAVEAAIEADEHLLVQAGTGTGKSLAYLVPAVAHAVATGKPAVVATATLALQAQIVDRDMPRLAEALAPLLGRRPTYELVKGRRNYLCQHKLDGGFPDDEEGLFSVGQGAGRRRRRPASAPRSSGCASGPTRPSSGDRDELVPGVSERAWRQVSVSRARVPGRQVPDGQRVLRRAGPRRGQGRRRRRHQPLASWRSTPSRAARCCPSTTCWSSTRRTSWSTGSPRRSPTS